MQVSNVQESNPILAFNSQKQSTILVGPSPCANPHFNFWTVEAQK